MPPRHRRAQTALAGGCPAPPRPPAAAARRSGGAARRNSPRRAAAPPGVLASTPPTRAAAARPFPGTRTEADPAGAVPCRGGASPRGPGPCSETDLAGAPPPPRPLCASLALRNSARPPPSAGPSAAAPPAAPEPSAPPEYAKLLRGRASTRAPRRWTGGQMQSSPVGAAPRVATAPCQRLLRGCRRPAAEEATWRPPPPPEVCRRAPERCRASRPYASPAPPRGPHAGHA
mmetsp:Transcript_82877/g.268580  ORF Transcript_82877/g.268580 Transcript_82877/m.268580 type:complete len:231 (-) Transcript_82877:1037-1729(-)